jgi:hypothetical protein
MVGCKLCCQCNKCNSSCLNYIFKGARMQEDYIKLCRWRTCMAMQKKTWMIIYPFNYWLTFFYISILGAIFQKNRQFLIFNGHGSHVIIHAFEQAAKLDWTWWPYLHICHMHCSHWTLLISSPSKMFSKKKKKLNNVKKQLSWT